MLMQIIPSADAIGQTECKASRAMDARTFVAPVAFTQPGIGIRIGRLENEAREISRTMNDVLARATCDLKDDARRWRDIAKDIENEIAITQCCGRIPAIVAHSFSRIPGTSAAG